MPYLSKYYSGGVSTETEPLLGQALQTQTDLGDTEPDIGKQKECDYSVDQVKLCQNHILCTQNQFISMTFLPFE